jgi:lysophospholipase L1-like esterase
MRPMPIRVSFSLNRIRRPRVQTMALALLAAAGATSCDKPTTPAPTPVETLALFCPTSQAIEDLTNQPMAVTYPPPQATGGQAPIATECTPASGGTFPVGTTGVSCRATDTSGQAAACTFSVTLTPVPMISVTTFLAFGDSLTEGKIPVLNFEDPSSYPNVLRGLLQARYKGQTTTVINAATGGQSVDEGSNILPKVLDQYHPQALLLLQGILDLDRGRDDFSSAINLVLLRLRSDVQEARKRGIQPVFLSTLLPEKPPLPGYKNLNSVPDDVIVETNDRIRAMAAQEGVTVVEGYAAISVDPARFIGGDGLHLTVEGYQALAEAFFGKIQAQLEEQ